MSTQTSNSLSENTIEQTVYNPNNQLENTLELLKKSHQSLETEVNALIKSSQIIEDKYEANIASLAKNVVKELDKLDSLREALRNTRADSADQVRSHETQNSDFNLSIVQIMENLKSLNLAQNDVSLQEKVTEQHELLNKILEQEKIVSKASKELWVLQKIFSDIKHRQNLEIDFANLKVWSTNEVLSMTIKNLLKEVKYVQK